LQAATTNNRTRVDIAPVLIGGAFARTVCVLGEAFLYERYRCPGCGHEAAITVEVINTVGD
jgi:hypothetical protein